MSNEEAHLRRIKDLLEAHLPRMGSMPQSSEPSNEYKLKQELERAERRMKKVADALAALRMWFVDSETLEEYSSTFARIVLGSNQSSSDAITEIGHHNLDGYLLEEAIRIRTELRNAGAIDSTP